MAADPKENLRAAEHAYRFLMDNCRAQDGRFYSTINPDGTPNDTSTKTYDLAFVLGGLARYHQASHIDEPLRTAESVYLWMQQTMADPSGGFAEQYHPDRNYNGIRTQGSHMHLLDAMLTLYEVSGDAKWLDAARPIVDLFRDRFCLGDSGAVMENFNPDWSPRNMEGPQGTKFVPGLQYEWSHLMFRWRRHTGDKRAALEAEQLLTFACRGNDVDGLPFNQVDSLGRAVDRSKYLWAHCERVAAVAAHKSLGISGIDFGNPLKLVKGFSRFLRPDGTWWNCIGDDGHGIYEPAAIRLVFHLRAIKQAAEVFEPQVVAVCAPEKRS